MARTLKNKKPVKKKRPSLPKGSEVIRQGEPLSSSGSSLPGTPESEAGEHSTEVATDPPKIDPLPSEGLAGSSGKIEVVSGSLAEADSPAILEEKIELLGFHLNEEEYAIPINQVKEIIRPMEMTVIPGSSPILMGIISLRGVIIPVFTLNKKLADLKPEENLKGTCDEKEDHEKFKRIIIVHIEQGILGLLVDGVTDVIKIKQDSVQPPPSLLNQTGQEMIKGITRYKERLVILLYISRVVEVIQEEVQKIRKL